MRIPSTPGGTTDALLLTPDEAFKLIGVGRSFGDELLARGEIPSIKIGRLRRIPREALQAWVEAQSRDGTDDAAGRIG